MWSEFEGIFKAVKLKQAEAQTLQSAILACVNVQEADKVLSEMEPEERGPSDCREYRAFHALCKAGVYYESKLTLALDKAYEEVCRAIEGFRSCGNDFNEGISYRLLGLIYHKQGKINLALAELERAIKGFRQRTELYENEQNFKGKGECERQIRECERTIQKIKNGPAGTAASSTKAGKGKTPEWLPASISYPVYDFAHASREGKYVMDDMPIGEVTLKEITINGEPHKIYAALENDREVTLVAGNDYRWLHVAGESMNRARPTPILPDDYVLVDTNRQANIGDIVVASLLRPPTPLERAGVVKRRAEKELQSESEKQIAPIPLTEARISGVVIAIAKPMTDASAS